MSESLRSNLSLGLQAVTAVLLVVVVLQLANRAGAPPQEVCQDPRPDAFAATMDCDQLAAELLYELSSNTPAEPALCRRVGSAGGLPGEPCQQLMIDLLTEIGAASGGGGIASIDAGLGNIMAMLDEICERLDDLDTGPGLPSQGC